MWRECSKCHMIKSIDDFHWHTKSKGTKRRYCKICGNKQTSQTRKINKKKFDEWKNTLSCEICGENRGPCLVFHHNQGIKNYNISDLLRNGQINRAIEEIKLTQVLCHNCHLVTHNHLSCKDDGDSNCKLQSKNQIWWHNELLKTGCVKCGFQENAWALHSHHIDPTIKVMRLSRMVTNASLLRVQEEFLKCITLCANCHMEFHYLERNNNIDLNTYLSS